MTAAPASDFFSHIRTVVDPSALFRGTDAGWRAPVGIFDAKRGFGEPAWVNEVPITMISFRLCGAAVVCRTPACGGRTSGPRRNAGLQPAGTPNASSAEGPVRFAQIYLPDPLLDRVTAELGHPKLSGLLRDDLWFFEDDAFDDLVRAYVLRADAFDRLATRLEMEARSLLLLERLVTAHHRPSGPPAARGGLAAWQERRVVEHLRARLAHDVSLGELAALVQLSTFHFARMFRRSTGLPPHAYLRRLRCERARHLLATTDEPVTEIALAVGYESSQALARLFQREVGCSPSAYRRDRRGST